MWKVYLCWEFQLLSPSQYILNGNVCVSLTDIFTILLFTVQVTEIFNYIHIYHIWQAMAGWCQQG